MVVTIDGPAGAGKSSVAKKLAMRLGYRFLDTGAMYRAMAWAAKEAGVDWQDREALAELATRVRIEFAGDHVLVDDRDVSAAIRTPEVTEVVRYVADHPGIRQIMVERQRDLAQGQNLVTEGRDQGTVVFSDSRCKIFLTASPQERARRRVADFRERGESADYEDVLQQIRQRDDRDESREVGCLVAAEDAIHVITDGMSMNEVVDHLERIVRSRLTLH